MAASPVPRPTPWATRSARRSRRSCGRSKDKFVSQAAERGVPAQTIDAVFQAFQPFERYGFNKAHATCYGLVAYETAYLKANFTVEYMTAVLTAFRDNAEKVAAAIAECRRLGIEVRPPDIHASHLEFTVEGDAIRFGLLAVKNVGEGAIESIIAAREADGPFSSLTDFCGRIDLRLANRKVVESLARVGALNALGHPAQVIAGLDDALAAGQAAQRDRATGQASLFELAADEATGLERPLPSTPELPVRERLRWEKELLGLYLSEHPMGEIAEHVGPFVTAYSTDLGDESLDGQRVVVAGIVTGLRTVVTKARQTMAVATLEDVQGSIEVVVFPRTWEATGPVWQEGAILLVAGRIDHRGEDVSLLADLVTEWESAQARGPEAFAREVSAGDRGAPRRRGGGGPGGNGPGPAGRVGNGGERAAPVVAAAPASPGASGTGRVARVVPEAAAGRPVPPTAPVAETTAPARPMPRPGVPYVSPLRPEARPPSADALGVLPAIAPGDPIPTYSEPEGARIAAPDRDDEPALPDEVRASAAASAAGPTPALDAGPANVLHVHFSAHAGPDRLVSAMEAFRTVLRGRPGPTRVVLHVPSGSGDPLPMELRRGVAYDAELLAEVRRRLGEGLVELQLG